MLSFSERLFSLLVSPYTFVLIQTYEEDRVVMTVKALASQMGRVVHEWAPGDAPLESLLAILGDLPVQGEGSIAILKDAHPYLNDPRVVRRLRELEPVLSQSRQAVMLVTPVVDVPIELLKDITVLEAPLPGRVELEAVLDEVFPGHLDPDLPHERLVSAALGLTMREARRAYFRARFERQQSRRRHESHFDLEAAVLAEKRRLIEADRVLEFVELGRGLQDVGGLEALKGWLREREHAFSARALEFGLPVPRGLLLTGVQGCGKSLVARAVAAFWAMPLLRLDMGRLFDGALPAEAALQRAIHTAEALAPSVLWLDEIDKAFAELGGSTARMMGSLLTWLQDKHKPVFFVATANRVQQLPPELLRKGRFDEVFFVDLPAKEDRADILRIHIVQRGRKPEQFDLVTLADKARFFSGAELEQVVVAGLYKAFAQNRDLTMSDLEAAQGEIVPLYRTYEEEIKAQREWAAGRARPATRDKALIDLFKAPKG